MAPAGGRPGIKGFGGRRIMLLKYILDFAASAHFQVASAAGFCIKDTHFITRCENKKISDYFFNRPSLAAPL